MKQPKILIADDERAITEGLGAILRDEGYQVSVAVDGQKALDSLSSETFGLILADLKMPKLDGLAILKELQKRDIPTECIIVTGQATVDSAVQAMREGAYDYIEKPLNAEKLNRLKALIPKALEKFTVQQKNRELSSKLEGLTHYGELTGQSEAMRNVYQVIDAVAPSTASVQLAIANRPFRFDQRDFLLANFRIDEVAHLVAFQLLYARHSEDPQECWIGIEDLALFVGDVYPLTKILCESRERLRIA